MEEVDAFGDMFCSVSDCSDVVLIIAQTPVKEAGWSLSIIRQPPAH